MFSGCAIQLFVIDGLKFVRCCSNLQTLKLFQILIPFKPYKFIVPLQFNKKFALFHSEGFGLSEALAFWRISNTITLTNK